LKLDLNKRKYFYFHYHPIFGCWPVQILASGRAHYFVGWQPPEIPAEGEEWAGGHAGSKGRAGGPSGMWLPSPMLAKEEE